MELLDKIPNDLKWNVIKYLKHPVAEIISDTIEEWIYNNPIIYNKGKYSKLCFSEWYYFNNQ
jgi:hypothetical protein